MIWSWGPSCTAALSPPRVTSPPLGPLYLTMGWWRRFTSFWMLSAEHKSGGWDPPTSFGPKRRKVQGDADCLTPSPLCSTSALMSRWLQHSGYMEPSEHLLPVGCEPSPQSCYASVSCSMREEHLSLQITASHLLNHAE